VVSQTARVRVYIQIIQDEVHGREYGDIRTPCKEHASQEGKLRVRRPPAIWNRIVYDLDPINRCTAIFIIAFLFSMKLVL